MDFTLEQWTQFAALVVTILAIGTQMVRSNKAQVKQINDRLDVMNQRMHERFDAVNVQFEATNQRMDERFDMVNQRLDKVDTRLDRVDGRLDAVDERLRDVETKVTELSANVTNLTGKADLSDKRLARLEDHIWHTALPAHA